jgi:DNA-binding GntR family transcriptional regulator
METLVLALTRPARRTLGDGVADSIRQAIFGGIFKPGQRLPEAQIARSLQVSRAPVRDALDALEQEGLVNRTASGGSIVTSLTRDDFEEICTLRLSLETLAVERLARRGTQEDWTRLANILRATEHVRGPRELARVDLEFHEAIVRAARHGRLLANWLNLKSQILLIMVQRNVSDDDSQRGTLLGHTELLAALKQRNAKSAASRLEKHLREQRAWVLENFENR